MSDVKKNSTIADDSKPVVGRIYDYFLGGNHNFEIDRIFAKRIVEAIPMLPKMVRMGRWFMSETVRTLASEGYRQFLDFASGLPLQDHIHQITPEGTAVIYSDVDPITVELSKKIIGNTPNVAYTQCDAITPEVILDSDLPSKIFASDQKTAIGMTGVSFYLEDEALRHSLEALYRWAKKGDRLYIFDAEYPEETDALKRMLVVAKEMNQPFHWHSRETLERLAGDWVPRPPGSAYLEEWLNIKGTSLSFFKEEKELLSGSLFGVIFEKQ